MLFVPQRKVWFYSENCRVSALARFRKLFLRHSFVWFVVPGRQLKTIEVWRSFFMFDSLISCGYILVTRSWHYFIRVLTSLSPFHYRVILSLFLLDWPFCWWYGLYWGLTNDACVLPSFFARRTKLRQKSTRCTSNCRFQDISSTSEVVRFLILRPTIEKPSVLGL